jgi:hypothetical protein
MHFVGVLEVLTQAETRPVNAAAPQGPRLIVSLRARFGRFEHDGWQSKTVTNAGTISSATRSRMRTRLPKEAAYSSPAFYTPIWMTNEQPTTLEGETAASNKPQIPLIPRSSADRFLRRYRYVKAR